MHPSNHLECVPPARRVRMCACTFSLMQIDGELSPAESRVVKCALSLLSCSLSTLQCAWHWSKRVLARACVHMSLLWSEMTLRDPAILSETVNIIQYQATGINTVLVLLLAEMCRCFSLLSWQHFFLVFFFCRDLFPIRDVPDDS